LNKGIYDEAELNRIIKQYEYLISIIITSFVIMKADYDDAYQEGRIGLYKAILAFRENSGAEFVTFASVCIKRHIISFLRKHGKNYYNNRLVQIDDYESELYGKNYLSNELENYVYTKNGYINALKSVYEEINPIDRNIYSHYIYGYSINEISETYAIPKKRIYTIIARTKKKIETKMNE